MIRILEYIFGFFRSEFQFCAKIKVLWKLWNRCYRESVDFYQIPIQFTINASMGWIPIWNTYGLVFESYRHIFVSSWWHLSSVSGNLWWKVWKVGDWIAFSDFLIWMQWQLMKILPGWQTPTANSAMIMLPRACGMWHGTRAPKRT